MFSRTSQAIIYGRHLDVAQRMLDFDFLSDRTPSIAGIIDPSVKKTSFVKLFFWKKEVQISIYPSIANICKNENIDTFLNFASFRSATQSTWDALKSQLFDNIVIIAEGIPERDIREIIAYNNTHDRVRIIGPATAGAICAGALRMGNAGWSIESIVDSRLYRAGSVGFVSRSWWMSNEMYRVISQRTDGIHTGIALWGDRFVVSSFAEIIQTYQSIDDIAMIVMLWEVWSRDELAVAQMIQDGIITKPVVAYVSGSFAEHLATEIQFWHAGAKANAHEETASYKNQSLRTAGAFVPDSYTDFWDLIAKVYQDHVGNTTSKKDQDQDQQMIQQKVAAIRSRISTKFTSTISDERWDDLLYNKTPIAHFIDKWSIAQVIGALWLKRELPDYALEIINMIIILLADHGPAVSGATNTIVSARAGKDILSSLVSWLMTIGPRFWGAIDGAARCFYEAVQSKESPQEFVDRMKCEGNPIPWIWHKIKSKFNPDSRCKFLQQQANTIPTNQYLSYALEVEQITLEKKLNLILNVDGHIAAILLDIFESIGMNEDEIRSYIDHWLFNAFFIFARSIGLIGHALDQKNIGEWLHRTDWKDIFYT